MIYNGKLYIKKTPKYKIKEGSINNNQCIFRYKLNLNMIILANKEINLFLLLIKLNREKNQNKSFFLCRGYHPK